MINKIITHPGFFHADELVSIALVSIIFGELPIERKDNITEEEFEDNSILILDVGKRYQPNLSNLDHHQCRELPATNLLLLDYLISIGKISELKAKYIERHLFNNISDIDRGIIHGIDSTAGSFNSIISKFNLNSDWKGALEYSIITMKIVLENAENYELSKDKWEVSSLFAEGNLKVKIHDNTSLISDWQDFAKEEDVQFLITKSLRGGYSLVSRNSDEFPIINLDKEEDKIYTFRHHAGFLAVCDDIDKCINLAKKSYENN